MRLLRRNTQSIKVLGLPKKTPIKNSDGLLTGEYTTEKEERFIRGTVVPKNGKVFKEIFGEMEEYDYLLLTLEPIEFGEKVEFTVFGKQKTFKFKRAGQEHLNHNAYGLIED